jgi:hypothetical protein
MSAGWSPASAIASRHVSMVNDSGDEPRSLRQGVWPTPTMADWSRIGLIMAWPPLPPAATEEG